MAAAAVFPLRSTFFSSYDEGPIGPDEKELLRRAYSKQLMDGAERVKGLVYSISTSSGKKWMLKITTDSQEQFAASHAGNIGIGPRVVASSLSLAMTQYVTEKYDASLDSYEWKERPFAERLRISAFAAYRLACCHRYLGPHGDIKLDNIVYKEANGDVRLIDFPGIGYKSTFDYLSPERAKSFISLKELEREALYKADVYAMAMSVFAVMTGKLLPCSFLGERECSQKMLVEARANFPKVITWIRESLAEEPGISEDLTKRMESIFSKAFCPNPEMRLTSGQLFFELYSSLPTDIAADLVKKGCEPHLFEAVHSTKHAPEGCGCSVM